MAPYAAANRRWPLSAAIAALAMMTGAAFAQASEMSHGAYKAYAACLESHVADLAARDGSPGRIADKIGRLCQDKLTDFMITAIQDQVDLGLEILPATHEANLVVQQIKQNLREATIAQVVTARLSR